MSKKEQLRQADELVAGMQEMFEEMTKEVMDATTESEDAMKWMDMLKSKAASAHAKYIEHKLLANELNNEVRDSSLTQQQLELENEEYKATIEYLYDYLDEQQRDFNSIVKYIDKYYAEEATSPKPIAKHYVPNKSGGGKHAEWLPHVDKLIMEMLNSADVHSGKHLRHGTSNLTRLRYRQGDSKFEAYQKLALCNVHRCQNLGCISTW
jgi:hypothetical protein